MRMRSLSRMARLSAVPLGAARRLAWAGGLRAFGRLTDESALDLHERTADQLVEVLGGLRGGVLKFGQVLSVYEAVMPPKVSAVYRGRLAALQEAVRPEPAETVERVMGGDVGADWRDLFASFDTGVAAAASLGQVHRARWAAGGRDVAVKIQYPDARDELLGDRDAVVLAMRMFTSLMAPQLDGKALATELMDRLAEELDYAREAEAQRAFRAAYRDDPDFLVPDVLLHRGRVIVSEWIGGTPLARVIEAGGRPERDRAGLLLTRLMFAAIARCGMMHADPHPGNFRLLDDGRLGVLDFGAVYRHEPGTPTPLDRWMDVHLAALDDGTGTGMADALRRAGFLRPGVRADEARLRELFLRSGAPAFTETFRFDGAYLRDALEGITASMPVGLSMAFPPGAVHAQRALGVGIGVLCQLEAEVPFQAEALRWLAEDRPGPGGPDRPAVTPPGAW
ncbi:ABC1 kinase family protein [Actinomadura violacea]|uniref:AarF/ABC1/UbiB kinase family protein n=1 Tax=Actinomadura violacea TaxID=2819934 RepID=A0ABS3RTC4_9ACTN|nr:AarF/ABC1/UbiB kinase family protein [Actinomadura violacea]MBO2459917.1 AarF/ABC1/UbiB kinase family protein [Actinomadura violacea]